MARSRSGSVRKKRMTAFPFRLCPHATDSALGAAPYDVAAQEESLSCTSRQTVYAVGSGGVVKAHPKWQSKNKTKRPGTFRCPGLFCRELGRCAPTRNLHPVTPDPRTFQRAGWLRLSCNARSSGADSVEATACRNHRTIPRARAPGPKRVECWRGSMRCSRWFLVKLPLSAVRGLKGDAAWAAMEDNCK